MIKLLAIYFSALAICTMIPARISSVPFINLSQSIQFDIDPDSPVVSVEKDFLESQIDEQPARPVAAPNSLDKKAVIANAVQVSNLNSVVGKTYVPRQVAAVQTPMQKSALPVLDYSQNVRSDRYAQLAISGPVELKQGLALTDEHTIEIHRESRGAVVEYGEVDIEKGIYSIKLSNLEGHICARLRGSNYEVIGEGCFSLDRMKGQTQANYKGPLISISRYKDVLAFSDKTTGGSSNSGSVAYHPAPQRTGETTLRARENPIQTAAEPVKVASADLKPSSKLFRDMSHRVAAQAKVTDFYDYDNPDAKPLAANFETASGNVEDSGSTSVTIVRTANHPPAILVANAYTPSRGVVIPNNKTHDALKKIALDQGVVSADSPNTTVWGRTMKEGRSVAGMQVEIEGHDELKPVYLNEFYIPDTNQKSTASHGLYTFLGVPEGEYSVRATQGNQFAGYQSVTVKEDMLSIADIDSTDRKRPVRIAVYDLINKTSQGAVATLQNYEDDVVVESGQADIEVQDNYDTAYALVNPLNKKYLTAQYLLNAGDDLYNFPMVSGEWVENVLSHAKLERPVRSKLVLGIGAQTPFRVQAIGSKSAQVVYFDSNGQVVEGNFGTAGGGFFIIDPEESVNEFVIQAAGQKTVRSIYMPTIPNVLNIIQL